QVSGARIEDTTLSAPSGTTAGVTVAEGVTLDTRGLWSNLLLEPENIADLPYQNGGGTAIRGSGDVTWSQGCVVDVSSGAAILADGKRRGGKGGGVTRAAARGTGSTGALTLEGELRA